MKETVTDYKTVEEEYVEEVTRTDYKTVEETYERTICDECGTTLERDEEAMTVALNPTVEETSKEFVRAFHTPHDAKRAYREMSDDDYYHMGSHSDYWAHSSYSDAVQVRETMQEAAAATATLDLCPSCAVEMFDIELPEDAEVSDLEFIDLEPVVTVERDSTITVTGSSLALALSGSILILFLSALNVFGGANWEGLTVIVACLLFASGLAKMVLDTL